MKNKIFDVIVVGSGPAGVHAAYPLIEAGLKVALVDGGLTGDFKEVAIKTDQLLPIKSNLKINQSLTTGGLSEVWPGISDYFSSQELEEIGLPVKEINNEYPVVAKRINLQNNLKLDHQIKSLLNKSIHQLPVAPFYKTASVVQSFKRKKNFTYISNFLVSSVKEKSDSIEICSFDNSILKAKHLILAAGAINTTRILLKSFKINSKVPFLTKGYNLFICVNTKSFLKKRSKKINLLGQAAITNENYFIQFYPFNQNSLSKISLPLPKKLTSQIFSGLGPYLVIADVRFNTKINQSGYYQLKNDLLEIHFKYSTNDLKDQLKKLKQIKNKLYLLGLIPLKLIKGDVTSHYAGGDPKLPLKRTYIADSSTWKMLPGKPPTLTIMANASRVGKKVLENFK